MIQTLWNIVHDYDEWIEDASLTQFWWEVTKEDLICQSNFTTSSESTKEQVKYDDSLPILSMIHRIAQHQPSLVDAAPERRNPSLKV